MRLTLRDRRWDPDQEKAKPMWDRLNEAWRDLITLVNVLDRRLTLRTVDFTGPMPSMLLTLDTSVRPQGIVLVGLYEVDTNATSVVTFSWTWGSSGFVTTSFSALPAGSYRATFLVIGGS